MKKGFKKILALAIVLTMAMSFVPFALAAPEDGADWTITIKGVTVGNLPATITDSATTAKTNTVTLELTAAQMANTIEPTAEIEDLSSAVFVFRYFDEGNDSGVSSYSDLVGLDALGDALTTQALSDGGVIWIAETEETGYLVRIEIELKEPTNKTGTIDGTGDPAELILEVLLPTELDFLLDPITITEAPIANSGIARGDYAIVNEMDKAAVKVHLDFTLTMNDGKLVEKAEDVPDDDMETEKVLTFGVLGASDSEADPIVYGDLGALVKFKANADGSKGTGSIAFALDRCENGVVEITSTAFTFYGDVNAYADWDDGDVLVSGAYTLIPLPYDKYCDIVDNDVVGEATLADVEWRGEVKEDNTPDFAYELTFGASPVTVSTAVSRGDFPDPGLKLKLTTTAGGNPTSITSVTMGSITYSSPTDWEYDAETGIFHLKRMTTVASGELSINGASGFRITFSNVTA